MWIWPLIVSWFVMRRSNGQIRISAIAADEDDPFDDFRCLYAQPHWELLMNTSHCPVEIGQMFRYLYAKIEMLEERLAERDEEK